MASTRIIAVGSGTSAHHLERIARIGTGQFVLIDPELIEFHSVGSLDLDPRDLGRPKVNAPADLLAWLNPDCHVWTVRADHSEILDPGFRHLIRGPLPCGPDVVPALHAPGRGRRKPDAQDRLRRLG